MSIARDDVLSGAADRPIRTPLYPGLPDAASRLHVVLLVPRYSPRWLADFTELATAGRCVNVSVVSIEGEQPDRDPPPLPLDMRVYLTLERLRNRRMTGSRLSRIDFGALQSANVRIGDSARVVADAVAHLQPDLVLMDAPQGWHAALAGIARCGCWQLDADLLDERYAGLSLLQPVLAGANASTIDLQLVDDSGLNVHLSSSTGATHAGSFQLQRDSAFAKLPALLLRDLRDLATGTLRISSSPSLRLKLPHTAFAPGDGVCVFLAALRRTLRWQIEKRRPDDLWLLLLRDSKQPLDPAAPQIDTCSVLVAPRDDYWADPCIVEHEGRRLIFAEEYPARTRRAVIVCLELLADGRAERLGIALDQTCHLSYPQAFLWQGTWHLIVESGGARCVRLYRASDFPLRWQPVTDLVSDRVCVDPTLHHHDGHWYLFVNISESGGSTSEELFLFVSEQLEGPFLPHPANPIVSDVRRARPAGRLFEHHGRLIRPGQDCAESYGNAIVFSEVLELTPESYRERALARLDGSWSTTLDGCHTYSAVPSLELLDARGKVPENVHRIEVVHASISARASEREVPLVSVLMCMGDETRSLDAEIDNVLAQDFADHEILIASRDPATTAQQLEAYIASRPERVRVIDAASLGHASICDLLLAQARGRYIAWYETGYFWVQSHLSCCLELLERDAALAMVHAQILAPEPDGVLFGRPLARKHAVSGVTDPYTALLLWWSHPVTGSVVMRRSTALIVGAFDGRFSCRAHIDRDYWLRIAAMADVRELADGHVMPASERVRDEFDEVTVWQSRRMLIDKHRLATQGKRLARHALAAMEVDRAVRCFESTGLLAGILALGRALWRPRVWQGLLRWVLRKPRAGRAALR